MKSIYEASVAYGREQQGTVNIEDFEAGANYVLEQIEQLIYEKQVKGNLSLFDLTYLIDKLKEK